MKKCKVRLLLEAHLTSQTVNLPNGKYMLLVSLKAETNYPSAEKILKTNPFRYRGYYYDTETSLYYLNSRYYDPETGRFVNADDNGTLQTSLDDVTGKNLFAYCDNNPVTRHDPSGYILETILDVSGIAWSAVDLITKPSWANAGYLAWDIGTATNYGSFIPDTTVPIRGDLISNTQGIIDIYTVVEVGFI